MKWVRLWVEETLKGTTFQELDVAERGVWFSLLVMAGDSLEPGVVQMRKGVGYTPGYLATFINCEERLLQKALKLLQKVGKIKVTSGSKDGKIYPTLPVIIEICKWEKYQSRYDKYYKGRELEEKEQTGDGRKVGRNNGISMPGRKEVEGEVEEDNISGGDPPDAPVDKSKKQHFPKPTPEESKHLILLNKELEGNGFSLFVLMSRFEKRMGYFPPIPLTIRIAENCIKAKAVNKWGYFEQAYKKEMKIQFAELNIWEHRKYKNEPVMLGGIFKHAGFKAEAR